MSKTSEQDRDKQDNIDLRRRITQDFISDERFSEYVAGYRRQGLTYENLADAYLNMLHMWLTEVDANATMRDEIARLSGLLYGRGTPLDQDLFTDIPPA